MAGPPSPEKPAVPVPATVVIVPEPFTLRTRWFVVVGDVEVAGAVDRHPVGTG